MSATRLLDELREHLEHFRLRVLQDAVIEGTRLYWLRRANQFAAVGNARADEIARACRNAAALAPIQAEDPVAGVVECRLCTTTPPAFWLSDTAVLEVSK